MSKLKLNTDYLNKPIESDTAIEESKSRFSFNFDYLDTPPEGKEITQKPLSRGEKSIRAFESRLGELTNQLSQIDSAKAPDEYNKTKENIDFIQNSLNNARENFGIDTDKIVRRESGIKQTSPQNAFAMYERFTPAEQSLNVAPREEIGKKTEQVKKLEDELKKREGNLTFLKNKLDSFKLDKTDQKSVNQYNQIVNDINSEVNELQKVYKNYGDTFKNYQQTVEQYLNPLGLPKDVAERNFGKNIPISEDKPLREGKIFSPLEKIGAGLEYGFTTQIPELMSGGIETINQIMANTQLDPTTKALIPAQNYEPDSSILSEASKRLKEFAESNKKEFKQIPADDFLFELTNNGTTFLSSIVLGTAAGLIHPMLAIPVVGMNTFLLEGGESFNNAYDYYKSKGIDEKTAKRAAADQAVVTGTIKAGLESLVPLKVANKLFGKSISKVVDVPLKKKLSNLSLEMFETGVSEARQEFLQATTDIIAESLYKEAKDKPTIEKWLNEGGKSALYGFVLGMFGGGGGNVVEQVRAKKQIDDFAKEFSKILDEKDITIDDVSANEAVLTEYERGKLLGERRGKEFTGFPMEQEQDETANFLKTAYEQLKPSEVSTFTGFPIDQQEPIEKPEKFAATIQNELNRQANIKKKQQEKRNLKKRKKAEQDVFAELNRQVRNAERKKNLIDINALQNLADNIQVQEIKDKAVKSIERARKSNEKIKQRNEFTLENLARKRFGTSNLNSLDEEQQQNLLNEYNSMKAQGIENFGKLNTVIPVIQLPPLLAEERIQGLITPQEPQPQEGLTFEGNVLSQLEGERDARTIRSNQEIAPQRTPGMEREESQRSSSKDLQLETGKQRQPGTSRLREEKREDEEKAGDVEKKPEVGSRESGIDKSKESRVNFYEFPPDEINVNTEAMQNRETKFSKQTYDSIVEDVKSGNFDLANIPPVMVYKDNNGKLWTLNHSRLKAYQDLKAEGKKDFNTIPVQEVKAESLEEASKLAKEKTNIGAKETPAERAKIYRNMRSGGVSENRIIQKAQQLEGKNSNHILNISYLNPSGDTIVGYKSADENVSGSKVLRDVADYIGEARRRFKELTNAHEDELFKWLFTNGQIDKFKNKFKFIDNIEAFVKHESFDPAKPLGVGKNKVVRGAATIGADKKLEEARKRRKEIEKERKDFEEGKILLPFGLTERQYLDEFSKKLSNINNEILQLTEDRRKAVEADRLQDDLFSQITEEVPNERASEIITGTNPSELEELAEDIEGKEKSKESLSNEEIEGAINKADRIISPEEGDGSVSEQMPEFGGKDGDIIYSLLSKSYNGLEIPPKRFTTYLDKDGEHSLDLWAEEKARVVKSFLRNFITPQSYEKFNDYKNRVLKTIPELKNATESLEKKINKALKEGKAEKISLSSAPRDFNLTETEIQKLQERLSERNALAAEPLEELKPYAVKESDLKLIEKRGKIRLSIYDREKIFGSKDENKRTKGRVEQALRESKVQSYPGQRSTGVEQAERRRTPLGRGYEQTDVRAGIPRETVPQEIRPVLYHFAKKGSVNVIGLQLGENYLQDIADSYYIFRNPFIEVLHFIGRDADNKIIESIPITSNASNYVDISNLEEIINRLKERGAKKVTVLHNHPSGVPDPSASDYKTIAAFRREFKKQADIDVDSAVVINGDRYASWDVTDGGIYKAQLFSYESPKTHPLDKFYRDFDQSPKIKIGNAKDAAKYFSRLRYGKGNITVVVLDNHLRIRGWDVVSKQFKDDTENFADYIEQLLRVKAGSRTMLVGNREDFDLSDLESIEDEYGVYHKRQQKLIRSGYTTRLIDLSVVYDGDNFIAVQEYVTKVRRKAETVLSEQLEEFNKKQDIFYSQLERVTEAKAPGTITPKNLDQYLAMLKKNGVKDEEIEWLGIEDFVKEQGKVSKNELVDFIRQNNVRIEEVEKGKRKFNRGDLIVEKTDYGYKLVDENGTQFSDLTTAQAKEVTDIENALLDEANKYLGSGLATTNFSQYQLPGGENYREMLLTMPVEGRQAYEQSFADYRSYRESLEEKYGDLYAIKMTDGEKEKLLSLEKQVGEKRRQEATSFKSSHFDELNILAHVRMNDRTDSEGRKILFLEEVQSDWHEAGRKKGYKDQREIDALIEKREELNKEIGQYTLRNEEAPRELRDEYNKIASQVLRLKNAVPNAPFKKTWHELALKRMLRYAAENDYSGIAWTTGEMQADRYDLSKQIDAIKWDSDDKRKYISFEGLKGISEQTLEIYVDPKSGVIKTVDIGAPEEWEGKQLSDVVGKEVAEKVLSQNKGKLEGEGLKVGGEGMKGFYDKMIPSFLNKYAKKWGARVGETEISTAKIKPTDYESFYDFTENRVKIKTTEDIKKYSKQGYTFVDAAKNEILTKQRAYEYIESGKSLDAVKDNRSTVPFLPITESMKESVMEGQVLFESMPEFGSERARREGGEPNEWGALDGNVGDIGRFIHNNAKGGKAKAKEILKEYKAGKKLGLYDGIGDLVRRSVVGKYYNEWLTNVAWFFDKNPQLQRVWDVIDQHLVRNINEENAILTEDYWQRGKPFRKLPKEQKAHLMEAFDKYINDLYEQKKNTGKTKRLTYEQFVDKYKLAGAEKDFFMDVFKPLRQKQLELIEDHDRYMVVNTTENNPYLEGIENAKDKKIFLESAKKEFFEIAPNAEFLFEQQLLKQKKNKEVLDEAKALNDVWKENEDIREIVADDLIEKKYKDWRDKVEFPTSRLDHKYFVSAYKPISEVDQLIYGMKTSGDKVFYTTSSKTDALRVKNYLDSRGYQTKPVGEFKKMQETLLENAVTVEDIIDLVVANDIEMDNETVTRLLNSITGKGFTRHFIEKNYIPGFKFTPENFEKALIRNMNGVVHFKNRAIGINELGKTLEELKKNKILDEKSNEADYIRKLRIQLNNQDYDAFRAMRSAASVWYLTRIAYFGQQGFQPFQTLLPYVPVVEKELGLKRGTGEKAFGEAIKTAHQYYGWKFTDKVFRLLNKKLDSTFGVDPEFMDIMKRLERQGVGKPLRSLELAGEIVDPTRRYNLNPVTESASWIGKAAGTPGILLEDFTRVIGIRTFYLMGKKAGLNGDELLNMISNNIAKTYGAASGKLSKPPGYQVGTGGAKETVLTKAFRSIANAYLTFKNFGFMNYGQWGKIWRMLRKDRLYRAMFYKLATTGGMFGFRFMMWSSSIMLFLRALAATLDWEESPEEKVTDWTKSLDEVVPGLGTALYKGVVSLALRVDLSALFSQSAPFITEDLLFYQDEIGEALVGAPGQVIRDIVKIIETRDLLKGAPTGVRNYFKGKEWEKGGVKFGRKQIIGALKEKLTKEELKEFQKKADKLGIPLDNLVLNAADVLKKKMSFTPLKVSEAYERENAQRFRSTQYSDRLRREVSGTIIPMINEKRYGNARAKLKELLLEAQKLDVNEKINELKPYELSKFVSQIISRITDENDREALQQFRDEKLTPRKGGLRSVRKAPSRQPSRQPSR